MQWELGQTQPCGSRNAGSYLVAGFKVGAVIKPPEHPVEMSHSQLTEQRPALAV